MTSMIRGTCTTRFALDHEAEGPDPADNWSQVIWREADLFEVEHHERDHHFLDPFVALGAAAAVTARMASRFAD
jgi:hypothetical protein